MYKGYRHLFISIVWICMNSNSEYILIAILIFWHHYNVFPPIYFLERNVTIIAFFCVSILGRYQAEIFSIILIFIYFIERNVCIFYS